MLVTVIRPFPFSRDGRTTQHAEVSPEPQEVPDAMVPGLVAEGYLEQPEGLPLIPMSAGRRKAIIDRVTELFRAHMEALSDEQLTETLAIAERQTADAAERAAFSTKVVDGLEHGAPEPLTDDLSLAGLAALADVDLTQPPAEVTGDVTGQALPPIENAAGEQTAPPAFDPDTADEAALRAFLTARDGKEPDKRFGEDRLRALAKAAPAAEGASE